MIAKTLIFGIVLSTSGLVIKGDVNMMKGRTINSPVIVYVEGDVSESSAKSFARDMKAAHETGQSVIPVVIRSYGGNIYSLFSMIDTIKAAKVPVATIVVGKAMSAGAALLTCGTEGMRYAAPSATIMIHEASTITRGKVGDIKADADELTRLNGMMLEIMSENMGKNKDYLSGIIHSRGHADWYLTPEEAIKHNVVNHIGVPELGVQVTVKTVLK